MWSLEKLDVEGGTSRTKEEGVEHNAHWLRAILIESSVVVQRGPVIYISESCINLESVLIFTLENVLAVRNISSFVVVICGKLPSDPLP